MDLNTIPLFSMLTQRLNWLSQRQSVLAQNIANANTPGYKPKDLKELSFRTMLAKTSSATIGMAKTSGAHLAGTSKSQGTYKIIKSGSYETTPSGNAVVLEEQLMKSGETRMNYRTTLNLYRKHIELLKTALNAGR